MKRRLMLHVTFILALVVFSASGAGAAGLPPADGTVIAAAGVTLYEGAPGGWMR